MILQLYLTSIEPGIEPSTCTYNRKRTQ